MLNKFTEKNLRGLEKADLPTNIHADCELIETPDGSWGDYLDL